MGQRYDAVLFDLDGTLIDSREDLAAAVNFMRGALGLDVLPIPVVQTYVGDGVRKLVSRALETDAAETVERGLALLRPYYAEHCLDRTRLYPGIAELLGAMATRRGLRLGVVSNKPERPSEAILRGLGIRNRFAAVIGGDTASALKPDPAPLREAAARLGAVGSSVLIVGDGPNDIEGARRAGFASCGVLWGFKSESEIRAARPDHVASEPDDVRRLVLPPD